MFSMKLNDTKVLNKYFLRILHHGNLIRYEMQILASINPPYLFYEIFGAKILRVK